MWDDLGKYRGTGFGIEATSWTDVKSYIEVNGIANWEAQLIHAMSKAFVDARGQFTDVVCEPPYRYGDFEFNRLSADAAERRAKGRKK
jgi:hypothetical protein